MYYRQRHRNLSDYEPLFDAEGHRVCLNCNKRIMDPARLKYCDDECAGEFFRKNDHGALRTWLIFKCNGTCALCGKMPRVGDVIDYSQLVMDHVEPVCLGGPEFDENNCQILCRDCDRKKTAEDRKRIALQRKNERG